MLHDVALHDVICEHQAYVQRKKDLFIYGACIAFCIWLRPHEVHVMHARFAREEIINSLRENNLPTPGYVLNIKYK